MPSRPVLPEEQPQGLAGNLAALGDRYRILGELGRGGMGVVYHARDATGRDLALKVISGRLQANTRERFRREAELTAQLRHPGIVGIHGGGEADGVPFIAYEFVPDGRTLEEAAGALDRGLRLRLLADVCAALGYAHAHGMVHRDIKPENILVDREGRPHLADFGLAWTDKADRLTRTGAFVGTPAYMAPEQFEGRGGDPQPSADVWSLGVILYELLVDQPPFQGGTLIELASNIRMGEYERLRKQDRTIPKDLEAVCAKALSKAPEDRYRDAAALGEDLENVIAGRSVSASPPSRIQWIARRRGRTAGVLLASAALLGALGLGALQLTISSRTRGLLDLTERVRRSEAAPTELVRALEESAGVDPSTRAQSHALLAASGGLESTERVRHAERAAQLASEPAAQLRARIALATLLAEAGDVARAREALERAEPVGGTELRSALARALLAAGEWERAEALARSLADSGGVGEREFLARLLIRVGRLEDAEASLSELTRASRILVRADLDRARGRSPLETLERGVIEEPRSSAVRAALVRHLLEQQQPYAARQVLASAKAADPQLADLERLLAALLPAPDAERLRGLPSELVPLAADALLGAAERELAAAERLEDPRSRIVTRVTASERRARARGLLGLVPADQAVGRSAALRARAEEDDAARRAIVSAGLQRAPGHPVLLRLRATEHLADGAPQAALRVLERIEGSPSPEEAERAALLEARALVRLERHQAALEALAGGDRDHAPTVRLLAAAQRGCGKAAAAASLDERAERLETPDVEAAAEGYQRADKLKVFRRAPAAAVLEVLEREVFVHDPLCPVGRNEYYLSQVLSPDAKTRREGLLANMRMATYFPAEVGGGLTAVLLALSTVNQVRLMGGEDRSLEELIRVFDAPGGEHAQLRGLFRGANVEYEQKPMALAGLAELEVVLRERPDLVIPRAVRGFLNLRRGRLEQAEADLVAARELSQDCALVTFYQGLLAAARSAPREEVASLLAEAGGQGHKALAQDEFSLEFYPELRPYRFEKRRLGEEAKKAPRPR